MKALLTILFLSLSLLKAGTPDWVKDFGKSSEFPESVYFTGFGMCSITSNMDQNNAMQAALDYSRSNLAQKIKVSIQSRVMNATEETNKGLSQYFRNSVESFSELQVEGLESKSFVDGNVCYCLSYIGKDKLLASYEQKIKSLNEKLKLHYNNGVNSESKSQTAGAIREYTQCLSLLKEIESSEGILKSFTSFKEEKKAADEAMIRTALDRLIKKPVSTPEDASWYLAFLLKESASDYKINDVQVGPLMYQDTRMCSKFSNYFKNLLEGSIVNIAGWKTLQQPGNFVPRSANAAQELKNITGAGFVITGSYWENGDKLRLMAVLRDVQDGSTIACAETELPKSILSQIKIDYKPRNYKEALSDQAVFNKDEVIDAGLKADVVTNKGNDNLIFSEDDTMDVYIRVNMPCHLRFVYHMADGSRVVLLNDYFADESKVNMWFQPENGRFVCAEPFGMESLQVLAQTEAFPAVKTKNIDGYDVITEDIESFVKTTRGFKKLKPKMMQSEERLVITTISK